MQEAVEAMATVPMIRMKAMEVREEAEEPADRVAPEEESSLFPQRRLPIMQPFLQTEATPRQGALGATGEMVRERVVDQQLEEMEEMVEAAEEEEVEVVSLYSRQP